MEKKEFAELVKEALVSSGCQSSLGYSSDPFSLYCKEEKARRYYLDNAYRAYSEATLDKKEATLNSFIQMWLSKPSLPTDFEAARDDIWPILRAGAEFYTSSLAVEVDTGVKHRLAHRGIDNTHLSVGLAFDTPKVRLLISRDMLQDWNVDLGETIDVAMKNLSKSLSGKYNFLAIGKLYQVMDAGPYGDTIFLQPGILDSLGFKGDPVVMVPRRNQLLVADSQDDAALSLMVEMTKEALESKSGQFCSSTAIQLKNGKWSTYSLPEGHKLQSALDFLHKREQSYYYSSQKEVLVQYLEKIDDSSGVATYQLFLDSEDKPVSMATWSNGVDTLLPVTDLVCLVHSPLDENSAVTVAKWKVMQRACCRLLTVSNHSPIRFQTRGFPSPELLEKIKMELPK